MNMEAPPKEPDPTPLEPSTSSPCEDGVISASDGVVKNARPQPHTTTTTAFLLQGEFRSEASSEHHETDMIADTNVAHFSTLVA